MSPVEPGCGIVAVDMGPDLSIAEAFEKWADELVRYATVLVGADEAHDAVGQAFADVYASNRWPSVMDPRAYLFRATLNAARSQRRTRQRRLAREWRTRPELLAQAALLGDQRIVAAVNTLSVQQRAVIFLSYWEDMTPAAIARTLEVSEGTIRRHLARARAKLRKVLS